MKQNLVLFIAAVKKNISIISICIITLIVLNIDFQNKYWSSPKFVIENDVKSYYAYLPAVFIYNDLSLRFTEKDPNKFLPYIWNVKTHLGKKAIVTTMGLSFMYLPFFLIAHLITPFTEFEADGYTAPYKLALLMSCLFYLVIGLLYLKKILKRYYNQYITAFTLFAIVFGTNLLMYTTYRDAPMPHVFSFALINIYVYYVIKWYEHASLKNTIILGLVSGLIALIRPTNILVLLIFIFYNICFLKDIRTRIEVFLNNYKKILLMAASFVVVWIPQFIYWKYISGHFLYFTYKELLDEGFIFSNPQIINLLFSYRKGWLVYTPIMTIALIGIPILYYKLRQFFIASVVYLIFMIYVLSSWWSWWYGGSFGMRSMIDLYGIMAIPFAAFINFSFRRKKIIAYFSVAIIVGLIWLNLFQSKQYVNGAIHWSWMTKEAYWKTFLKKYPTQEYQELLRRPDYKKAKEGIRRAKKNK